MLEQTPILRPQMHKHTRTAEMKFDKKEGQCEETEGVGANAYQKGMGAEGNGISSCNGPEWHPNQEKQLKIYRSGLLIT